MQKIKVRNLDVKFGKKNILSDINFEVESGSFVAVLGKSGAGKSTLLNCIIKFINFSGILLIDNQNINKLSRKSIKKLRKKIGIIFQDYNVFDNLYTIENAMLPFLANKNIIKTFFNIYSKEEYKKAIKYLKKVGLSDDEIYKKTKYLSGGQKQRVAIARTICQKPNLILADEPVSSLDVTNSEAIMKLFYNLNKIKKTTIIMTLHDIDIAKKYSDKILGIKDGKVVFYKNTKDVLEDEIKKLYN